MATERYLWRSVATFPFAAFVVLIASCSSSERLHIVRGKILVNGKPAAGAMLVFHPEGGGMQSTPATAIASEDGTFHLVTGPKSGARAGKYVVTVVWPDPTKKPNEKQLMMGLAPDAPDLLAGRFANPKSSTLRVEIKSGENDLEPMDLK